MKVLILHSQVAPDADPDEQDVLAQVEAVSQALTELGHACQTEAFTLDLASLMPRLQQSRPDLVFNLVESIDGKGRLVHLAPSLLDHLTVPYTGAPAESIFLTSHKILAKRLMQAAGILTPPWATAIDPSSQAVPGSLILKSVWEHASIGITEDSVAPDWAVLKRRLETMGGLDNRQRYVEKFIDGREFNISMLGGLNGPEVLPPAEILFVDFPEGRPRIVDYRAKWEKTSFEYTNTLRSFEFGPADAPLLSKLASVAVRCWEVFELRGYARVDFRVDPEGTPWVLEVNANPCIAPEAGFIAAAARIGLSYADVVSRIIEDVGRGR